MEKNKKFRKSLALFVLAYLLMFLILVGGCVLVGLGYKTFVVYDHAFRFYQSGITGYNSFSEFLNNFNANVVSQGLENKASIDMFAPGLSMLIISVLVMIILTIFLVRNLKSGKSINSQIVN